MAKSYHSRMLPERPASVRLIVGGGRRRGGEGWKEEFLEPVEPVEPVGVDEDWEEVPSFEVTIMAG